MRNEAVIVLQVYYNIINVPNESALQTATQSQGTYSGLQSGLNGNGAGSPWVAALLTAWASIGTQHRPLAALCVAGQCENWHCGQTDASSGNSTTLPSG